MKILITMKLADRSLKYHIYPLTLLKEVDKIMLVRDKKGPIIDKVEYYCPPNWILKLPILALFCKFLLLIFLSIKEKPAMIHAYLLFPHGILAFIAGKLTDKRCGISLIAGPMELYVLGGSPIRKYSYNNPLPKLSILGKILVRILKSYDFITVTGTFTKKFLIYEGIDENKIFVLPHILDDRFKFINTTKVYDIVYIGRLTPVKHIDTLIKAVGIVKKYFPKVRVAIVGDGRCRTELEKLTKILDLTENINFAGHRSDIWNWYSKSKLSVLTSEREGFPYSVAESLSCGLPVIISNCGDVCDVIKDNYNGIIVDNYQDYHSFAQVIIKLLRNPQIITEHSVRALKTAENMSVEKAVCIWKDIISYEEN